MNIVRIYPINSNCTSNDPMDVINFVISVCRLRGKREKADGNDSTTVFVNRMIRILNTILEETTFTVTFLHSSPVLPCLYHFVYGQLETGFVNRSLSLVYRNQIFYVTFYHDIIRTKCIL